LQIINAVISISDRILGMNLLSMRAFYCLLPTSLQRANNFHCRSAFSTLTMATVKLNTGAHKPIINLGTWQSPPGQVEHAVEYALR
jgi:hypothetical protein